VRWNKPPPPSLFDTRRREGFLFFPKRIENEVRWWERAAWIERAFNSMLHSGKVWHAVAWDDGEEMVS
jgi:hypothetical protein